MIEIQIKNTNYPLHSNNLTVKIFNFNPSLLLYYYFRGINIHIRSRQPHIVLDEYGEVQYIPPAVVLYIAPNFRGASVFFKDRPPTSKM